MVGILCFVIYIAVDVVDKEAHRLHIREELCSVGEIFYFNGSEEYACTVEIALSESLENLNIEIHIVQVRGRPLYLCWQRNVGSRQNQRR